MNRNIAKQFAASLSLLDVASDKTNKYKCFHGEDVQLTVKVIGEHERPIDLSNTSVKIYFTLDKNVNEPVYRQDAGIVVNNLGIITVMLEKSYIRIGNNTLKIVLYDEDQTVFLQPLIITCIDPLIGEVADLEIPDDIDVRDELYDIRRIIGDLQDFDDDLEREIIEVRNEYETVGKRLDNVDLQLDVKAKEIDRLKYANKKFIAHKGFVALAPENTLKSTEKACEYGFDMVEMDVTMSKDYKYVLYHDSDLSIMTNGTGNIYDRTLSEIQQFNINKGVLDEDEVLKIPTFEDAVKICGNYGVGINIDASKPDIPYAESNFRYFIQLLKDNSIFEKSCIATENTTKRLEIMKVDPNTTLLWVTTLANIDVDLQEIKDNGYKNVMLGYNATYGIPTRQQINYLHENGVRILMYGVHDYELYLTVNKLNVDYIETETIFPNGGGR